MVGIYFLDCGDATDEIGCAKQNGKTCHSKGDNGGCKVRQIEFLMEQISETFIILYFSKMAMTKSDLISLIKAQNSSNYDLTISDKNNFFLIRKLSMIKMDKNTK